MKKKSSAKLTGEVVLQYLERFPDAAARSLAKKIYAENSELFHNTEHVRGIIRDYIGQNGNKNRDKVTNTKFYRPAGKPNVFSVPESECDIWKPVHISETHGLLFSDTHAPYHDKIAVEAMINHAVNRKLNFILINGDGLDYYQLSKFKRDPRKRSLNDELWLWVGFLELLQKTFPGTKIYWKLGNHEERLEAYLRVKAPELLDMEEFKLGNIIKMRGINNVTIVEKQIIYAGRLPIIHGHEFQSRVITAVNAARGLFLKALSSSLVSHYHRSSSHSEKDINEKLMGTWSIGCLCGLHPEWALLNNWNHGFAYLDIDGREFNVENLRIHKGKVYRD